jgi:hypothetical protein
LHPKAYVVVGRLTNNFTPAYRCLILDWLGEKIVGQATNNNREIAFKEA